MSDIVERLRDEAETEPDWTSAYRLYVEAADTITSLRSQLEEARSRADRMADDWIEFCEALSLEWGDQQHAVNQIVANFNKGAEEARENALEEAAKVADDEDGHFTWAGQDRNIRMLQQCAHDIAAAIRKLKEKP